MKMLSSIADKQVECVIRPWMLCPLGQDHNLPHSHQPICLQAEEIFDTLQTAMPSRRMYEESLGEGKKSICAA